MLLIILKCFSLPIGEEEIPSLYLLGEVAREQLNSSLVSLLQIRVFYPGLLWGLQSELHWVSKQKTNSQTQTIPPIPQIEIDYRPQRASSKIGRILPGQGAKSNPGKFSHVLPECSRSTIRVRKWSGYKKETPAICTKLHNLSDVRKPQAFSAFSASATFEQFKQHSAYCFS